MNFIRTIIELSTSAVGLARRGRRISPPIVSKDGYVKVNLGCGLAVAKGWVNIDASLNALLASWPRIAHKLLYHFSGAKQFYCLEQYCSLLENHTFIHHDLSHSVPLKDQTADFVYSSHFLEHLFKQDAERLLIDCYRVLKPGGILRVSIPDLAYAISLYADGKKDEMLENYFFIEDRGSFLSSHKYMYDFESLKTLLEKIGFVQVERCAYQEGKTPDVSMLDNRPEDSLIVEAFKE